ncbi:MAG: Rieske 2Fe-2S domain-containing protein [Cytophagales bacterium]|jgi:cytochrome b6-f complex iron-sulfur subunit|nr:Rieske 2Fe-2S domain-containing protein [Cytophagales bacterium]
MNRGQFLKNLGLSGAALMSVYCLGGLTACSSEAPDPQNNNNNNNPPPTGFTGNSRTANGRIDFTLDLNGDAFKKLLTEGQFDYPASGDVIVARVRGGNFVALSRACTHQGTSVTYRLSQNDFHCDNHGSEFTTAGAVEQGPATRALTVYQTEFTASNNRLRVFVQ